MPKVRLIHALPQPAQFKPDYSYASEGFLYKVDSSQNIALRVPLVWDAPAGKSYYACAPLAVTKRRRRLNLKFRPVFATVATAVFVAGGFLVAYPLYPAVQYQVSQKIGAPIPLATAAQVEPVAQTNTLYIPKIGLKTAILESPTLKILDKKEGVWHQMGDLTGNFVLAGHRWKYLPPNISTFYNLDKLEAGDSIVVDWFGKRYIYTVSSKQTVPSTESEVLKPSDKPQITLYTCSDHAETQRIVVTAAPL